MIENVLFFGLLLLAFLIAHLGSIYADRNFEERGFDDVE